MLTEHMFVTESELRVRFCAIKPGLNHQVVSYRFLYCGASLCI